MKSKLLRYFSLFLLTVASTGGNMVSTVDVYAAEDNNLNLYKGSSLESFTSNYNSEVNSYKKQVVSNTGKAYINIDLTSDMSINDLVVLDSDNIVSGKINDGMQTTAEVDLKEGENIIRIVNKLTDKEMYKFYITYKNINIEGLKSDLKIGDSCDLKAVADGENYSTKWSTKSDLITLTEDGKLSVCGNGIAEVYGTIYDGSEVKGNIIFELYLGGQDIFGWSKNGEEWTYRDEETGKLKIGWFKDKDNWYYFNDDGKLKHGWIDYDNKRYYLTDVGNMAVGWFKDDDKWYYAEEDGQIKAGWFKDHGNWYYLNDDGSMQTSDKIINGSSYKFNKNGELHLE
ncbi:MAG: N-acetylmuramoyl-L-alanine amidase family protein [Clostridium sp.]|nr:N-acetylmuramoyl-L-alanine amidase family protein [Clostridium sp.]